MFTGTDETRGLEEWNVNTIAHLEPEKPESLSALWGGAAWASRQPIAGASPQIFNLCCYTVIITNSTNKMDLLAKFQARFSLASEGRIPRYYQEVRWAMTFYRSTSCSSAPPPHIHQWTETSTMTKNKIKYTEDFLQQKKPYQKTKLKSKTELEKT